MAGAEPLKWVIIAGGVPQAGCPPENDEGAPPMAMRVK